MKAFLCSLFLAATFAITAAAADDFFVYKATIRLPVVTVTNVGGVDKFITLTLAAKDVVNIALGRKLGSKVDAGKEILAIAAMEDSSLSETSSHSKLIIYDGKLDTVVATLCTLDSVNYRYASLAAGRGQGFGVFKITFNEIGNPAVAKFFATSTLTGAGGAKGPGTSPFDFQPGASGTVFAGGRMKFTFTDAKGTTETRDGLVVKGKISCSGKPLGMFSE